MKRAVRELPDGYAFEFPADPKTVHLVTEWAAGERACCPFLDIDIRMERDGGPLTVSLSGREGAKQFISLDNILGGPAPATLDYAAVVDEWVAKAEKEIAPAADAMPEAKYAFAPSVGEFHGVRTFGEQVKHLAAANYQLAALILEEEPPHGERDEKAPDSVRTKADVLAYLKGSFAYLHHAASSIDERNAIARIAGKTGARDETRLGLAMDAVAHSYDHYGQMVEYLRMNGIVPPASR